ncbi:spaetzle domain-containing protein [Xylocopa sonorina]|uniref:spaetzle domain-containing protein n=1 Tax=Xylocopa sonorina TaxID=1818115 RepID=UPI00403A866B
MRSLVSSMIFLSLTKNFERKWQFIITVHFFAYSTCKTKPNKPFLAIRPVETCKHRKYCEHTPYYPTDIVLDALRKDPNIQNYANRDEIDVNINSNEDPEEQLCASTEQIIFPKLGVTKKAEWKYIVNHESFTQSVRIETCLEQDRPCKMIEGFAEGYYTKCKQKYIYRELLALTPNGSISRESFQFPASCCCHIQFQADKFLRSVNSKN